MTYMYYMVEDTHGCRKSIYIVTMKFMEHKL